MQIILVQAEIEKALTDYVLGLISIRDDQQITIDLSATRGTDGFKALIDIVPVGTTFLGQEITVEGVGTLVADPEPSTLGIAAAISDAKADAQPVRRTRRTAAQIAADNAAAAAEAEPVAEVVQEVIPADQAAAMAADAIDLNAPLAETPAGEAVEEASEDAVEASLVATEAEAEAEPAPAPRQSLFGNLTTPKN